MALRLQQKIITEALTQMSIGFGVAFLLASLRYTGAFPAQTWLGIASIALVMGGYGAWRMHQKIKKGILAALQPDVAYQAIHRPESVDGKPVDWQQMDDYGVQLLARGYTALGDFTCLPLPQHFVGIAHCYLDAAGTTLIEIQQLVMRGSDTIHAKMGGIHFSIETLIAGKIRVTTSNHHVNAASYIMRGEYDVSSSHPGMQLLALLEQHERTTHQVCTQTQHTPSTGLTLSRHVLMIRTSQKQALHRIQHLSGWQIAREYDTFEQHPRLIWAPENKALQAIKAVSLDYLDKTIEAGKMPVVPKA